MHNWENIRWTWKVSKGFRFRIFLNGTLGLLSVGLSLLFIWLSKILIDIATGHHGSTDAAVSGGAMWPDGSVFWNHAAALAACMVLQLVIGAVSARLATRLNMDFRNTLRKSLFSRIMNSRWQGKEAMHTGDIINRIEEDTRILTDAVCRTVPSAMASVLQLTAAVLLLARLDWRLALLLFLIMPCALLFSKGYARKMRSMTRKIREAGSREQSHIQESVQHRTLISSMERTEEMSGTLSSIQADLTDQVMNRTRYSLFSRTILRLGFSSGYLMVFLWGASGIQSGTVTFGMMTAFLQLVSQIQRPVVDFSRILPSLIQASASADRLAEIDRLPLEEKGEPIMMGEHVGIRIENMSFAYSDGKRNVIEDFSYDFTPGSVTTIRGETGAGKSTLVRLLLALLTPDKGRITFYNGSMEQEASPQTRCNLIYVPQGNTLISGTIRDNLLLGNPSATDEEIRSALHTAAADFVYELPDGTDTVCGERGTGLSEGQAQRIAVARGLLRPGGILLLDEPTSALDPVTEQLMLQRLAGQSKGKTLIIVTHREGMAVRKDSETTDTATVSIRKVR